MCVAVGPNSGVRSPSKPASAADFVVRGLCLGGGGRTAVPAMIQRSIHRTSESGA